MSRFNQKFVIVWFIENYSFCDLRCGQILSSPIFVAKHFYETQWIIFLYPRGYGTNNFVSLNLYRRNDKHLIEKVELSFKIELCNSKNEVFVSVEKARKQFQRNEECLIPNIISVEDLKKEMKNSTTDTLTIRCQMDMQKKEKIECPSIVTIRAKTEVSFDKLSFLWNIHSWTDTKRFSISYDTQLWISLKSLQDDILFEIKQVSSENNPFYCLKCEILLMNKKGIEICSSWDFFTFEEKDSVWNFPPFLKKSLLDGLTSSLDFLYLKFNFSISNGKAIKKLIDENTQSNISFSPLTLKNISAINCLMDDLRAMLFNEKLSDVSFRIENEMISAHKFILAFRSPVFSAMFDQEMVENQTGVIEITDMDVQTLKLFLEFIYTGEIKDINWERALDLLLTSEKYQVSSLKEKCSEFLKFYLNCDNICHIVSVADIVGEESLKVAAISFIKENAEEVLSSPKWYEFIDTNIKLSSEIICKFSKDLKALCQNI